MQIDDVSKCRFRQLSKIPEPKTGRCSQPYWLPNPNRRSPAEAASLALGECYRLLARAADVASRLGLPGFSRREPIERHRLVAPGAERDGIVVLVQNPHDVHEDTKPTSNGSSRIPLEIKTPVVSTQDPLSSEVEKDHQTEALHYLSRFETVREASAKTAMITTTIVIHDN
jgi:hypothetical protein